MGLQSAHQLRVPARSVAERRTLVRGDVQEGRGAPCPVPRPYAHVLSWLDLLLSLAGVLGPVFERQGSAKDLPRMVQA